MHYQDDNPENMWHCSRCHSYNHHGEICRVCYDNNEDYIEDYDDEITRCQECDRWIEDDELVCPHCGAVQISRDSDE